MDPYDYNFDSRSIPEEDLADDDLAQLERELMPQPNDYYGVLNVSRNVRPDNNNKILNAYTHDVCKGHPRRAERILQEALPILSPR